MKCGFILAEVTLLLSDEIDLEFVSSLFYYFREISQSLFKIFSYPSMPEK
jgi:hypothetical protein